MINKTYTIRLHRTIEQQVDVTVSTHDIKKALNFAPPRYADEALRYLVEKKVSEATEDKTGLSLPKYEWTLAKIQDEIEFEKYKIEEIVDDFKRQTGGREARCMKPAGD
jgi:hypothetical protein